MFSFLAFSMITRTQITVLFQFLQVFFLSSVQLCYLQIDLNLSKIDVSIFVSCQIEQDSIFGKHVGKIFIDKKRCSVTRTRKKFRF